MIRLKSFEEHNIYADLLRELIKRGHTIYAVCPTERRNKEKTNVRFFNKNAILSVKTYNIQKTNTIEKGIATLAITSQFVRAIKKHFKDYKFDLILYPTPPITLYRVIKFFKKRDNARTYLMLKDIFPQNAVDLGMIKKTGIKGIFYRYFRKQEKKLYEISDRIGCMSRANVEYILEHNREIDAKRVEVFPNCIEPINISLTSEQKIKVRQKYGIPLDKIVLVYGGNLGKPQSISFVIDCIKALKKCEKIYFLVVGDGTDYHKLENFKNHEKPQNFMLSKSLPKKDFDILIASCDVGLIFLDKRFTIPNFPSRFLSYLQADIPVFACVDNSTDLGKIIIDNSLGWFCMSDDVASFENNVLKILDTDFSKFKGHQFDYLKAHFDVNDYVHCVEDVLNI